MARRIDIELTSARDDGTWTWRAAGARQPKGTLDGSILYPAAKVGDVVRADAEFEVDGITVVAVLAPKAKRAEPERIELLGVSRDEPGVRLVPAHPERARRPRREGEEERRGPGRGQRERAERGARDQARPPRERPGRHAGRLPSEGDETRRERARKPGTPGSQPAAAKPRPKRLQPGRAHRDSVLSELPVEQRPIAEQVLRGGLPAVRRAVEEENAKAVAEGRPEVKAEAILALAEELLPRLRSAEWLDRAEAVVDELDAVAVRDLRSVVTAAETAVHDDAGRELASRLREGLERRLAQQRDEWLAEVTRSLEEGRVVRALRISGRPPEPGTRFPADLAAKLSEAASGAMAADTTSDRWAALLDAVAASPVRRMVKPAGAPTEPSEDLVAAAKKAAPRVPGVAAAFRIELPKIAPPPTPRPNRPAGPGPRARGARGTAGPGRGDQQQLASSPAPGDGEAAMEPPPQSSPKGPSSEVEGDAQAQPEAEVGQTPIA